MELVLVLPIFLMLIFSIVEFSMLMSARTRVVNAANSGARMMSMCGGSSVEVEAEVHERVTTLLGSALARNCHILVQPAKHAGEIGHVTVNVPMKNASPDLLWLVGFSLKDRSIDTDATMVMERSASRDSVQRF